MVRRLNQIAGSEFSVFRMLQFGKQSNGKSPLDTGVEDRSMNLPG